MATPKTTATTAKKPTAAKAVSTTSATPKKTTTRKAAASKTVNANTAISPEEHYRKVEVAAYYLAERNGFSGNPVDYWIRAEAQIKALPSN